MIRELAPSDKRNILISLRGSVSNSLPVLQLIETTSKRIEVELSPGWKVGKAIKGEGEITGSYNRFSPWTMAGDRDSHVS